MIGESFPRADRRLRLGMVGGGIAGKIGRTHANGARLSGRWEVVAGALSSDPDRARESGRDWHLGEDRVYADYREMARAEASRADGIDAVAIVTPNHLHAPVALAFMEQGIDIICEKPVAARLEEVERLVEVQRETGVVFGVTYVYPSHVMARVARDLVRAGELGELRQVHVEYLQDWAIDLQETGADRPWRLDPERSGDSFTVADIGTHAEYLTSFVSGRRIEALRAEFHVTGAPKKLEDTAFISFRLTGGVPGTMIVSQAMAGSHCGLRIRLAGAKGSLEWLQERPEALSLRPLGEPERVITRGMGAGMSPGAEKFVRMPRGHPEALTDAWANLYLELGVAIASRRKLCPPPSETLAYPTLEDGVLGMKFVKAAVQSSKSGAWTPVG